MRFLVCVLPAISMLPAWAGPNLLLNGDFSEGAAHWSGDMVSAAVADTTSPQGVTSQPGVIIKLHPQGWTWMYQELRMSPGTFRADVVATFSPDLVFSLQFADYTGVPGRLGFYSKAPIDGQPGEWFLAEASGNGFVVSQSIKVTDLSGPQLGTLKFVDSRDRTRHLILAFPPGTGTVSVKQVTLTSGP